MAFGCLFDVGKLPSNLGVFIAEATFCEANIDILGNHLWRLGKPTFPTFIFLWRPACSGWRVEFIVQAEPSNRPWVSNGWRVQVSNQTPEYL